MGTITLTLVLLDKLAALAVEAAVLVKLMRTTIVIEKALAVKAALLEEAARLVAAVIKQVREEDAEVLVEAAVVVPL